MNEIGLKSCPFCGGELEYSFLLGASKCKGCGVMIGFPKLTRHEDKIIATNTRKPMDNIVEKLEEKTEFLKDCTKYGNENAEQQEKSYSTMMMYEVADLVDDLIDIVKQEINNGLE